MTQINAGSPGTCNSKTSEAQRTYKKENSMTHSSRNLVLASAFGAVTAIIMFAQAGQANAASSVLSCEGSNRRAVLHCCEERVNKYGLPLWMRQVGAHCGTPQIVKCSPSAVGVAAAKRCRIVKIQFEGGKGSPDRGRQSQR
jgi:hypothetical protein